MNRQSLLIELHSRRRHKEERLKEIVCRMIIKREERILAQRRREEKELKPQTRVYESGFNR
jgi:hypothetical protein